MVILNNACKPNKKLAHVQCSTARARKVDTEFNFGLTFKSLVKFLLLRFMWVMYGLWLCEELPKELNQSEIQLWNVGRVYVD